MSVMKYPSSRGRTVPGVITKFVVQPHSWVDLDATENGGIVPWEFETVSPNSMTRAGWKRDALKVGDTVSIVGNPHKEGKKVARVCGGVRLRGRGAAECEPGTRTASGPAVP
jgi:hypothetical protein